MDLHYIGKTSEGRNYPVLISHGDFPVDGKSEVCNKKLIIASARQHSGESPGSYVLEGFIKGYFGTSEEARRLRKETVLLVLPLVNLDGVEMGRYGKNAPPEDFNRAWSSASCRGEIKDFLGFLENLLKTYKPGFFVDFHSPQPGGYSYIVPPQASMVGKEKWRRINLFIDLFEKLTGQRGACRRRDLDSGYINWGGDNYRLMAKSMLTESYGYEVLTLETAYHEDCFGNSLEPRDWRFMGERFMEAARNVFFEDYDEPKVVYDALIQTQDGWDISSLPQNVKIEGSPGKFHVESTGNGKIIFSD